MKSVALILCFAFLVTSCSNDDEKDGGKDGKLGSSASCGVSFQRKAIYGKDDRKDWYLITDPALLKWTSSAVALVPRSNILQIANRALLQSEPYRLAENLCSDQPFLNQPTAAFCSGFFVGGDRIVTAGHCIANKTECRNTAFVFDYKIQAPASDPSHVPLDSVFYCKKLIVSRVGAEDFAVIQLDRPVTGRTPFDIRRSGQPARGQSLTMIGHPAGLPMKIADRGTVLQVGSRLIADVDAFGGNSGSVVVNRTTGLAEGILVGGNLDFDQRGSCRVEHRCGTDCDGEHIFSVVGLEQYVPHVTGDTSASSKPGPTQCN